MAWGRGGRAVFVSLCFKFLTFVLFKEVIQTYLLACHHEAHQPPSRIKGCESLQCTYISPSNFDKYVANTTLLGHTLTQPAADANIN